MQIDKMKADLENISALQHFGKTLQMHQHYSQTKYKRTSVQKKTFKASQELSSAAHLLLEFVTHEFIEVWSVCHCI